MNARRMSSRSMSDGTLLELVGNGDERAFEALVQRYHPEMLRYCRRLGLSETRAEDALQQAFLQAWLALERGTQVRELRPWLYRVVHNAAVNLMRASGVEHGELSEASGVHAGYAVDVDVELGMALREALADVAALPALQREAILMSAIHGSSHEEMASALGVTHG